MTQTIEQAVEANTLELKRLQTIYTQINEYANERYGMSMFELENAIERAYQFDNMFNSNYPDV
jgi:Cu/Ag efflux pump CusA